VESARLNLAGLPIRMIDSTVEKVLVPRRSAKKSKRQAGPRMPLRSGDAALSGPVDLVVLDPPRTGAGKDVVRAVVAAQPRAVVYVACDPAALGRDVATFREAGWQLTTVRAFDAFPNTQHIETIVALHRA
jgi:tRNA/tmRNA/rRNA uracil-C5-methylase (TrmA/RlmC/RlmD family)